MRHGQRGSEGEKSYLWVELVDFFNGGLDIPRMDGRSNVHSFLDRIDVRLGLNIGLDSEFLRRRRIAIGDEVVHNQIIDITSHDVSTV